MLWGKKGYCIHVISFWYYIGSHSWKKIRKKEQRNDKRRREWVVENKKELKKIKIRTNNNNLGSWATCLSGDVG